MCVGVSTSCRLPVPRPSPVKLLRRIAVLYKVEDGIRGWTLDERRAVRLEKSNHPGRPQARQPDVVGISVAANSKGAIARAW